MLGDDGDEVLDVPASFVRPDHIIFEQNTPTWAWRADGDGGADGGTVNELQDGENVMMMFTRQSDLEVRYDVFMWTDNLAYVATDDDHINAKQGSLSGDPADKVAATRADLKR